MRPAPAGRHTADVSRKKLKTTQVLNSVSALEKMPAPAATQERIVYKNSSERYMKDCLEFQDCGIGRNAAEFKLLLISALRDLSREADAALPLNILTCKEKTL